MSGAIALPRSCEEDPNSVELVSVWHIGSKYVITIRAGFFEANGVDESVAWGQVLADAADRILGTNSTASASLERVLDLVRQELHSPTTERSGDFAAETTLS